MTFGTVNKEGPGSLYAYIEKRGGTKHKQKIEIIDDKHS